MWIKSQPGPLINVAHISKLHRIGDRITAFEAASGGEWHIIYEDPEGSCERTADVLTQIGNQIAQECRMIDVSSIANKLICKVVEV